MPRMINMEPSDSFFELPSSLVRSQAPEKIMYWLFYLFGGAACLSVSKSSSSSLSSLQLSLDANVLMTVLFQVAP